MGAMTIMAVSGGSEWLVCAVCSHLEVRPRQEPRGSQNGRPVVECHGEMEGS